MAYEMGEGVKENVTGSLRQNLRAIDDLLTAAYKTKYGPGKYAGFVYLGNGEIKILFVNNRSINGKVGDILEGKVPFPKGSI